MKQFLLVLLVAGLLLFGCAGQGNVQASEGGSINTPPANNSTGGSGPANPPITPPDDEQPPAATGGSALDAFIGLLGTKATAQWKVSYDAVSTVPGQGGAPITTSFQMTQYMAPPGKFRIDSTVMGISARSYVMDDLYYTCSTSGSSWNCIKIAGQAKADATADFEAKVKSKPADYKVTADGTMQVAGVTANCYLVIDAEKSETRYCFSSEGVPLYVKVYGTANGVTTTTEMTATSYSTVVTDADFVLPAVATELNAGVGTGGIGAGAGADAGTCGYCSYLSGEQKAQCEAACAG